MSAFEFRRYARMRFQWQLHELEMRLPNEPVSDERVEEITRQFVAMYAERYGEAALLPGARLQIDSLRLEPAIAMGSTTLDRLQVGDGEFHQGTRPVYFERGAGAVEADVYNGDAMPVGERVDGPRGDRPGDHGHRAAPGRELRAPQDRRLRPDTGGVMTAEATDAPPPGRPASGTASRTPTSRRTRSTVPEGLHLHREAAEDIDPITYEVIRHGLWNANAEHVRVIENLAVSPIAVEIRDFQPCILTEDAELLYFGPCLQYMAGMLDVQTRYVLEHRGERVRDGDMWLCNDPIIGTAHQPDVGLMCPVFIDGEVFCWVANICHQNDIGGTVPGSFCPNAMDAFWDPPSFPPFKIVEDGKIVSDMEALYRRCSRTPENLSLDLRATIAGNHAAATRIKVLADKYGKAVVKGVMRRILDASQRAFEEALDTIPDGTYSERLFNEVSMTGDRGTYPVQTTVTKKGRTLTFDNAGTHAQAGAINVGFAAWRGSILGSINVLLLADQMGCVGGAARALPLRAGAGHDHLPRLGRGREPGRRLRHRDGDLHRQLGDHEDDAGLERRDDPQPRAVPRRRPVGLPLRCRHEPARRLLRGRHGRQHAGRERGLLEPRRRVRQRPLLDPGGARPERRAVRARLADPLPLQARARRTPAAPGASAAGNGGEIAYILHGGDSALGLYTTEGIPKTNGIFGGDPAIILRTRVIRDTRDPRALRGRGVPAGHRHDRRRGRGSRRQGHRPDGRRRRRPLLELVARRRLRRPAHARPPARGRGRGRGRRDRGGRRPRVRRGAARRGGDEEHTARLREQRLLRRMREAGAALDAAAAACARCRPMPRRSPTCT